MTKVTIELDERLEAAIRREYSYGASGWFSNPSRVTQMVRDALPDQAKPGDVVQMMSNQGIGERNMVVLYLDDHIILARRLDEPPQHIGAYTYYMRSDWKAEVIA